MLDSWGITGLPNKITCSKHVEHLQGTKGKKMNLCLERHQCLSFDYLLLP